MVNVLPLAVNSNASGDGSATDGVYRIGKLLAVGLDYHASAAAGTDVTVSVADPSGPAQTLLAVTDNKTDGWYYPRAGAVTPANAAITNSAVEIPFAGNLKVTVAQAGGALTPAVTAYLYFEDAA